MAIRPFFVVKVVGGNCGGSVVCFGYRNSNIRTKPDLEEKERQIMIMNNKKYPKLILISTIILLAIAFTACDVGVSSDNQMTIPSENNTASATVAPESPKPTEPKITEPTSNRPDYITIGGEQFNTSLTFMSLDGPLTNEDIVPLRYMSYLTGLVVGVQDPSNQITDLSPLAELTNLQDLTFVGDYISDITALAGLESLTWIHFSGRNYTIDITPLSSLTNLEVLQFVNGQVTDIAPLEGLVNLFSLDLSWNYISDLTPLAGLTNLETLILRDNQITDVAALAGLADLGRSNLRTLSLSNNQISDLTPLEGLVSLEQLWLDGNPITDFSPVEHVEDIVFEMEMP